MKNKKRFMIIIFTVLLFVSMFSGCRAEINQGPFDYPENMPKAGTSAPKRKLSKEGHHSSSRIEIIISDLLHPQSSDRIDSWYRVSVDKEIDNEKAVEIIRDYDRVGGKSNTFFEATIWYDYIRQEKTETKIILRQLNTEELQFENRNLFDVGGSYILLLARQFADSDITDAYGEPCIFQVLVSNGKDVAVQGNGSFREIIDFQVRSNVLNQTGYLVYNIEDIMREFQLLFSEIVAENDRYYMPTLYEFEEYILDKERFLKDPAGAETGDD